MGSVAKRRWVFSLCVGASQAPAILQSHQTGSFPVNTWFEKEN